MDLTRGNIRSLMKHLGHDEEVHNMIYQQTSHGTSHGLQLLNVGKLLMLHERNKLSAFMDKDLDTVDINGKSII